MSPIHAVISIPVLLLVELAYFKIADKYNIIDRPNERSSHKSVTLRGGGIIFYFSALYYFVLSGFEQYWFMAGLTLITIVSFADDISSLSSGKRMILQFISMMLMFVQLGIFSGEYPDTAFDIPSEFAVGGMLASGSGIIYGWSEILQYMRPPKGGTDSKGDFFRVYIPWSLAYGEDDYNDIKGYSLLVFDINLVGVKHNE